MLKHEDLRVGMELVPNEYFNKGEADGYTLELLESSGCVLEVYGIDVPFTSIYVTPNEICTEALDFSELKYFNIKEDNTQLEESKMYKLAEKIIVKQVEEVVQLDYVALEVGDVVAFKGKYGVVTGKVEAVDVGADMYPYLLEIDAGIRDYLKDELFLPHNIISINGVDIHQAPLTKEEQFRKDFKDKYGYVLREGWVEGARVKFKEGCEVGLYTWHGEAIFDIGWDKNGKEFGVLGSGGMVWAHGNLLDMGGCFREGNAYTYFELVED